MISSKKKMIKMKKKLFLIFSLCFSSFLFSQEYFVFEGKKDILTKEMLDAKIASLNKNTKKRFTKRKTHLVVLKYRVVSTFKRNDSIINNIAYDFSYEPTRIEKIYTLENKALPEFDLKGIGSKRIKTSDLKGKVTLINLWFTDCFPCVKEIPLLNVLEKKYKDKVNFVAITFDSKSRVKNFLKSKKFNFQHLVDANKYLKKELGNIGYPKILILDKEGVVRYIGEGIPTEYDYVKKKMKERNEKSLVYLEEMLDKLNK